MEFKAVPRTIRDAFDLKRKYVIPRFQREYSWEADDLEELWDDLIDSIVVENGSLIATEYFIGSLVLVGDDDDTANIDRQVVDGQQRLMTFTIAFAVLSKAFVDIKEERLSEIVHNYIVGEDENGAPYTKVVTETPKPFFQYRIQQKNIDFTQIPESQEEKRILNAYRFFENRLEKKSLIKEMQQKFPDVEITYLDILKLFRDQILKCKVIYVTVKSFDDAYTFFEVLNAKGKDLTPVDIIKNTLFSILTTTEPIDTANDKWTNIRDRVDDIATFYRHYWLSKYGLVTRKKLVRDFNNKIEKNEKEYMNFLDSLKEAADDYALITLPSPFHWTQPEDRGVFETLEALEIFGITQVRSFLLALFDVKRRGIVKHSKYLEVLSVLQHFHFVFNAVCSKRPSGLERRYSSYARKLRDAKTKEDTAKCINDLVTDLNAALPSYVEYEKSFETIIYTSKLVKSKRLIQYILRKIEFYLAGSFELKPDSYSIEHILPESTEHPHVGNLGNLLPLGVEFNNDIGSKVFSHKLKKYSESNFKTVTEFVSEHGDKLVWDEQCILDRTKQIAAMMN